MIGPGTGVRVYLACGVTDMRKGIGGLSTLAQDALRQSPPAVRSLRFVVGAVIGSNCCIGMARASVFITRCWNGGVSLGQMQRMGRRD